MNNLCTVKTVVVDGIVNLDLMVAFQMMIVPMVSSIRGNNRQSWILLERKQRFMPPHF